MYLLNFIYYIQHTPYTVYFNIFRLLLYCRADIIWQFCYMLSPCLSWLHPIPGPISIHLCPCMAGTKVGKRQPETAAIAQHEWWKNKPRLTQCVDWLFHWSVGYPLSTGPLVFHWSNGPSPLLHINAIIVISLIDIWYKSLISHFLSQDFGAPMALLICQLSDLLMVLKAYCF